MQCAKCGSSVPPDYTTGVHLPNVIVDGKTYHFFCSPVFITIVVK